MISLSLRRQQFSHFDEALKALICLLCLLLPVHPPVKSAKFHIPGLKEMKDIIALEVRWFVHKRDNAEKKENFTHAKQDTIAEYIHVKGASIRN